MGNIVKRKKRKDKGRRSRMLDQYKMSKSKSKCLDWRQKRKNILAKLKSKMVLYKKSSRGMTV